MLKSRRCREWLVLMLGVVWGGWSCTRLTEVDWSRIGAAQPGEGGEASTPEGGKPSSDDGGAAPAEGGVAGMPEEGGAAGEAGAPVGGSAGSGLGGMGGISGGAMGGTAGGGMGGTAGGGTGGGGTGSAGEGPIVIFDGPIADALVLYDGGADGPNGNYNGRTGLDQRCATAMTALALPHAKSIAFISVDETDHIQSLPSNHQVPEDKPIVSKTKVMLADNWVGLMGDGALVGPRLKVSLKRAEVVPVNAKRWLTGSTSNGQQDINYSCSNWTSAAYSTTIRGRIGSVSVATQTSSPNVIRGWLSDLFVTCDTGESHVLCLAY